MPRDTGRVIVPELLDHLPPGEALASLGDLTRINRWLGGHRILRSLLPPIVGQGERFRLLDVGAAAGDMGRVVRAGWPGATVVSLDCKWEYLRQNTGYRVAADAFRPPFRDHSFDVVMCSLFLHHFDDSGVVALLRTMSLLAQRAVVVIDLERSRRAQAFLPATRWLFRWDKVTLHDGPASVAAAFTPEELLQLSRRAGLTATEVRSHWPWSRLSLVARHPTERQPSRKSASAML